MHFRAHALEDAEDAGNMEVHLHVVEPDQGRLHLVQVLEQALVAAVPRGGRDACWPE